MNRPKEWKEVELDAICQETEQWNPAKEPKDKFYYIDVSSVSNDTFRIASPTMTPAAGAPGRARKIIHYRDVIFATIRPTLRRIALVPKEYDNQMASTAFCVIRIDQKEAVPEFIFYYLLTDEFNAKIAEHQHGASYPAVTDRKVREQIIPLPSLPEQRKIAAVLFRIQKAIELQEALIERTRELKKAAIQFVFTRGLRGEKTKETEIGMIPESWDVVTLQSLGEIVTGTTPLTVVSEYWDGNNPFITPLDIGDSKYVRKTERHVTDVALDVARPIPEGTIVVTCIGYVGKVGVVTQNNSITNQQINAIIPKAGLSGEFIYYLLLQYADRLEKSASQTTVPILNKNNFAQFCVACPTLTGEQVQICENLSIIDQKLEFHVSKKSALQDLFKTTLNKLMSGEIRVKGLEIENIEIIITGGTEHD